MIKMQNFIKLIVEIYMLAIQTLPLANNLTSS